MTIRLKRKVIAQAFDVAGTVAFGEKRPEFLAVVRLALDLGRPISSRDVTRNLLGGLPEIFGKRALERCALLRLLREEDGRYVPTKEGETALEMEIVPVPEEGVFRFWGVRDPFFPHPIIQVDPLETQSAEQERNELKRSGNSGDRAKGDRTPPALKDAVSVLFDQALGDKLVRIDSMASRGEWTAEADLHLELRWLEGETPLIIVTGELPDTMEKGKRVPNRKLDWQFDVASLPPDMNYDQAWIELAAQACDVDEATLSEWARRHGGRCLKVGFEELRDEERRTFKRRLAIQKPTLADLGEFEPTLLEDVQLLPLDDEAAMAWARWLQADRIREWQTQRTLSESAKGVRALFPYHNPRLLEPHELIDQARSQHPRGGSWFLLAPYDLGLWG